MRRDRIDEADLGADTVASPCELPEIGSQAGRERVVDVVIGLVVSCCRVVVCEYRPAVAPDSRAPRRNRTRREPRSFG